MQPNNASVVTAATADPALNLAGYKYFHHEPLDPNKASIRLLEILPLLSDQHLIQCRLRHFELHGQDHGRCSETEKTRTNRANVNRVYSCLSYTWGDKGRTRRIVINERLYRVHQNLWDFLDYARRRLGTDGGLDIVRERDPPLLAQKPLLWIDAICINQDDIAEKNHQVQQMGKIYAYATLVLMWLGKDCDISLPRDGSYLSNSQMETISSLCRYEYWSRAWITQEVVLARHPFICAKSGMYDLGQTLDHFGETLRRIGIAKRSSSDEAEITSRLLSSYFQARSYASASAKNLFHAWNNFGATKRCSNVLDRVYSLLALVPDNNIAVDYTITREQLLGQVITGCRNLLCFCGILIATRALEIGAQVLDVAPGYCVEVELPKYSCIQSNGEVQAKCYRCRCALPAAFHQASGSYFCLREICENMHGHLFAWDRGESRDSKNSDQGTVQGWHTLDCSTLHDIAGIEASLGHMTNKFPTRIWRFNLNALVQLAAIENQRHNQEVVRLCNKMFFSADVGGPLAMRKMRLCV